MCSCIRLQRVKKKHGGGNTWRQPLIWTHQTWITDFNVPGERGSRWMDISLRSGQEHAPGSACHSAAWRKQQSTTTDAAAAPAPLLRVRVHRGRQRRAFFKVEKTKMEKRASKNTGFQMFYLCSAAASYSTTCRHFPFSLSQSPRVQREILKRDSFTADLCLSVHFCTQGTAKGANCDSVQVTATNSNAGLRNQFPLFFSFPLFSFSKQKKKKKKKTTEIKKK